MKKLAFIVFTLGMAGAALANDAAWLTSLPQAEDQAKQENKLLLVDFTGSDWCGWCKKLDADTFSNPDFIAYANKNLVLVQVDFPNSKWQSDDLKAANRALKNAYGVTGFPTVLMLKPNGDVLWKQVGYASGGPARMIGAAEQCRKAAGVVAPVPPPAPPPPKPIATAASLWVPPPPRPPHNPNDEPKLQGILYSASHSSAVLDGRSCEKGDTVDGAQVLKIERDAVTVEFQGQVKILKLN